MLLCDLVLSSLFYFFGDVNPLRNGELCAAPEQTPLEYFSSTWYRVTRASRRNPGLGKGVPPLTIGWAFDGNPFGGGYGTGGTIVFTAELGRSRKRFCARHPVNEPDFCAF